MIGYLTRWQGSTDPDDMSGIAHYRIEAEDFAIALPTSADAQRLNELLWLAFCQGKDFAFCALKSHLTNAVIGADRQHGLSLDRRRPANSGSRGGDA